MPAGNEPRRPSWRPTENSVALRIENECVSFRKMAIECEKSYRRNIMHEKAHLLRCCFSCQHLGICGSQTYITHEWQRFIVLLLCRILFKFYDCLKGLPPITKGSSPCFAVFLKSKSTDSIANTCHVNVSLISRAVNKLL